MEVSRAIARVMSGPGHYAQWIRRSMARSFQRGGDVSILFGSSVDEPVELVREVVEAGFRQPITPAYQSAFSGGNPLVLQHLCKRFGVGPERIVCSTGATGALSTIYRTYLNPGDRVLVESPGFDLFADVAAALGAHVDRFQRRAPDFGVDPAEIERELTPRTRLVVVSNLHNPSGTLVDDATLAAVAKAAAAHGALLVVDEVYGDYADPAARPGPASRLGDNVLSVNSLTKIYGLSTLRCGWILGHPEVLEPIRAVSDHFEFGISKLAHSIAALVLQEPARFDGFWKSVLAECRPIVERVFTELAREGLLSGEVPPFGCIAFPRLVGIDDTQAFSDWLAEEFNVIVAPGEFFGLAGHVRVGFGQPAADLEAALARFAAGLRAYRDRRGDAGAAA